MYGVGGLDRDAQNCHVVRAHRTRAATSDVCQAVILSSSSILPYARGFTLQFPLSVIQDPLKT
jgi:hypothetical protein